MGHGWPPERENQPHASGPGTVYHLLPERLRAGLFIPEVTVRARRDGRPICRYLDTRSSAAHPPGTGPAAGHSGAAGLRAAHVRPLRRQPVCLDQTSHQYRTVTSREFTGPRVRPTVRHNRPGNPDSASDIRCAAIEYSGNVCRPRRGRGLRRAPA